MEKRTPHYLLAEVKGYVAKHGIEAFTKTARRNGFAMGMNKTELVAVVLALAAGDFYKAMTSYHDHTRWQDVYHAKTPAGIMAYVKITDPGTGRPVIQVKEL